MRTLYLAALLVSACGDGTIKVPDETDLPLETDAVDSDRLGESDVAVDSDVDTDTSPVETDLPADTDVVATPLCQFDDGIVPNLANAGPRSPQSTSGSTPVGSCTMSWRRFQPSTGTPHPAGIVLSHGFQRSADNVVGWAQHLASWGYEVVVPSLCHTTILDVQHVTNGNDLADLADGVFPNRSVIYVGHSAGGLASVVAADIDTDSLGVFGLDLVDTDEIAKDAAARITEPVWGVKGNNALCNSQGNGTQVYQAAANGRFHRIVDASHCDFEDPTDALCEYVTCALPFPAFDNGAQRNAIRALLTSFVGTVSGVEPDGAQYWTPGCAPHDALVTGGILR